MKKIKVNSPQTIVHSNKWLLVIILLLFTINYSLLTNFCYSQTAINTTGDAPHSSAMLDVSSNSKGVLINRMSDGQMRTITPGANEEGLMVFNVTDNCFYAYVNSAWNKVACPTNCTPISTAPTPSGASNVDCYRFTAGWSTVSGALSYYLDVSTDATFSSAFVNGFQNLNVGNSTSFTVAGLAANTSYYYRVRASSGPGCISSSSSATPAYTNCVGCGNPFTVAYTPGANGVPSNSPTSITYGTTNAYREKTGLCWLTKSLGATVQPTSIFDSRSEAAGWYFQFNRSQGYEMANDGVTCTPSSGWITTITSYPLGWDTANDPCTIQLGNGWRLPSFSEMVLLPSGWNHDHCAASSSPLAIAGSGYLHFGPSTAYLNKRGSSAACDPSGNLNSGAPFYYTSTIYPSSSYNEGAFWIPGWVYWGNSNYSGIYTRNALPVRCVHL